MSDLSRYSVIEDKNKREIILLRGSGCTWRKCRFCDYHTDFSKNQDSNDVLNFKELAKITGQYGTIEIINSGSFGELSENTISEIERICIEKNITQMHFEAHWSQKESVPIIKERFKKIGVTAKAKIGVESFDYLFRESYLVKGIDTDKAEEIAQYFDECCLLFGLPLQTVEFMENDIQTGLKHFERVCINIMIENKMPIKPDPRVISQFKQNLYSSYIDNPRIDILMVNTDFGVGDI